MVDPPPSWRLRLSHLRLRRLVVYIHPLAVAASGGCGGNTTYFAGGSNPRVRLMYPRLAESFRSRNGRTGTHEWCVGSPLRRWEGSCYIAVVAALPDDRVDRLDGVESEGGEGNWYGPFLIAGLLTPGRATDWAAGAVVLEWLGACTRKAYDSDALATEICTWCWGLVRMWYD